MTDFSREANNIMLAVYQATDAVRDAAGDLRDRFAMAALTGWIGSAPMINNGKINGTTDHAQQMAACAYRYADAMMAERSKPTGE